jgi:large subunit ribosomal protein L18
MIQQNSKIRRLRRVRAKISQNLGIPRLSVYRTNKNIWAQIIDDKHGKTLASASSKTIKAVKSTKSETARMVGEAIALIALKTKIKKIRFDRGLYRYHGRVKALADGARSKGLQF